MSRGLPRAGVAVRAGGAALAAALLLTGCAADVDGELRREVANLTDDVNAGNADGVSDSADSLIARTREAVSNNDIDAEEGARIIELATLLRDRFAALQPTEPTATPEPTEEPETEEPETEEPEEETEPPPGPSPSPRPPSPRPSQAPPSPTQAPPSPPSGDQTLVPEVPEG